MVCDATFRATEMNVSIAKDSCDPINPIDGGLSSRVTVAFKTGETVGFPARSSEGKTDVLGAKVVKPIRKSVLDVLDGSVGFTLPVAGKMKTSTPSAAVSVDKEDE